jgi:hypothetical protein
MRFKPIPKRIIHPRLPARTCGAKGCQNIGAVTHRNLFFDRAGIRAARSGFADDNTSLFEHRALPIGHACTRAVRVSWGSFPVDAFFMFHCLSDRNNVV